ncbi:unnamed protein product [Urochloa humidicola]
MSSKAAEMLGHPPGVKFCPDDDELVEFFLLPRVRGEPSWFPGVVVIDDDTAANTHPSILLERHGLAGDNSAYFFVRTTDAAGGQDRHCAGGGRWVSQKPVHEVAFVGGQEVTWRRANLNLQTNRGKSGGGSNGWVMHEYSLIDPPCPLLKICHVTLSGHGKDSIIKRVPDGEAGCQADEPAPKRARVAAPAGKGCSSKTTKDPDQEPSVSAQASSTCHQEQQPSLSERVTQCLRQPLTAQEIAEIDVGAGDTPSVASAHASAYQQEYYPVPSPIDRGISYTSNQQALDGTYLPGDAMPCMEFEERLQTTDQPVQGSTSTWSFFSYAATAGADVHLDQVPTIEQHQPMVQETSMAEYQGISATAHGQQQMVQETAGTAEQHRRLDEQEQLFWKSIWVDIDNIVAF